MFLVNHTLTGVALGLTIDNPVALAPVAVASHLAMDAVPHFGAHRRRRPVKQRMEEEFSFREKWFIWLGAVDFALSGLIALGACALWPQRALQIAVGVFGADLPDLVYIPLIVFRRDRVLRALPFYRPMLRFLAWIQWSETRAGLVTEVVWLAFILAMIFCR